MGKGRPPQVEVPVVESSSMEVLKGTHGWCLAPPLVVLMERGLAPLSASKTPQLPPVTLLMSQPLCPPRSSDLTETKQQWYEEEDENWSHPGGFTIQNEGMGLEGGNPLMGWGGWNPHPGHPH